MSDITRNRGSTPRRRDNNNSNSSSSSVQKNNHLVENTMSSSSTQRRSTPRRPMSAQPSSTKVDIETDEKLSHFLQYLNNVEKESNLSSREHPHAILDSRTHPPTVIHAIDPPPSPSNISITSSASNQPKPDRAARSSSHSSITRSSTISEDDYSDSVISFGSSVNNNTVYNTIKMKMNKMKLQLHEKNHEIQSLRNKLSGKKDSEKDIAKKLYVHCIEYSSVPI
jgi:hypothetical protein